MPSIARVFKGKADIEAIAKAIDIFEQEKGNLPKELKELTPKYIEYIQEDPWGKRYRYSPNNEKGLLVFSLGSDDKIGGEGSATDIYLNTELSKVKKSIQKPWWGCN
ncbi:MAG: type II secretion system protein GspG [Pseudomonadota bacterium]